MQENAQWIIDHRFIVNRQQLLGYGSCCRPQARSGAAREYDTLHVVLLPRFNFAKLPSPGKMLCQVLLSTLGSFIVWQHFHDLLQLGSFRSRKAFGACQAIGSSAAQFLQCG